MADLKHHGIDAVVYETYRSQVRQTALYRSGASQLKTVGEHHFGVAADVVFLNHRGELDWNLDYSILRKLALTHGLISGQDWGHPEREHEFVDGDHLQWLAEEDQDAVLSGRAYPADDYDPRNHRAGMIR